MRQPHAAHRAPPLLRGVVLPSWDPGERMQAETMTFCGGGDSMALPDVVKGGFYLPSLA